jgi:hypothetical protein
MVGNIWSPRNCPSNAARLSSSHPATQSAIIWRKQATSTSNPSSTMAPGVVPSVTPRSFIATPSILGLPAPLIEFRSPQLEPASDALSDALALSASVAPPAQRHRGFL